MDSGLDEAVSGGRNTVLELLLQLGEVGDGVRAIALARPDSIMQRRLELSFAGGCQTSVDGTPTWHPSHVDTHTPSWAAWLAVCLAACGCM